MVIYMLCDWWLREDMYILYYLADNMSMHVRKLPLQLWVMEWFNDNGKEMYFVHAYTNKIVHDLNKVLSCFMIW